MQQRLSFLLFILLFLWRFHTFLPFQSKPFPESFLYMPWTYMAQIAVIERKPETQTLLQNPISLEPMAQPMNVKIHPLIAIKRSLFSLKQMKRGAKRGVHEINIKSVTAINRSRIIMKVGGNKSVRLLYMPLNALFLSLYILHDTSFDRFLNPYFFLCLMKCLMMPISSHTF